MSFFKVTKKILVLLIPIFIWQVIEVFLLPIDSFTFRAWEALGVAELNLPGPFYPNQDLNKHSAGDQEGRTPVKWVRFITDKYGFRNRPIDPEPKQYEAVIIGDSNFAGSHIDQQNTLSEVLSRKCNCNVYNYAYGLPRNILSFFNDPRFKERPPKYVIFGMRPGDVKSKVLELPRECKISNQRLAKTWDGYSCRSFTWLNEFYSFLPLQAQIKIDRLYKQPFFHFAKSRLGIAGRPSFQTAPTTDSHEQLIQYSLEKVKAYSDEAKRRGMHFILLFFPYFQRDMDEFVIRAERLGIDTIGFLPNKKHTWDIEDYRKWMHKEDSHWLEGSIVETANLINLKLRSHERSAARPEYSSLRPTSQSRPQQ